VIIETGSELNKKSLPHYFLENSGLKDELNMDVELKTLSDIEKEHIKKIFLYTKGNKSKAAKILGVSRVNLIAKIKKYQLE
jgi:two-component system response regulator HydG